MLRIPSIVPHAQDVHGPTRDSVHEAVRRNDDLAIPLGSAFRHQASHIRQLAQFANGPAEASEERLRGIGVSQSDVFVCRPQVGQGEARPANAVAAWLAAQRRRPRSVVSTSASVANSPRAA